MSDSVVRKVPFNALPAQTRRRFVDATNGQGNAPLIALKTGKVGPYIGWTFVILSALFGMGVVLSEGFGSYWRPTLDTELWAVIAVGAWIVGYGVFAIIRRVVRDNRTPFQRGRFLFATDIVVAESEVLEIWPLNQISKVDVIHQHQNGRYVRTDVHFRFPNGRAQTFNMFGRHEADRVLNTLQSTQRTIGEAVQQRDLNLVNQLDLFFEARMASVWTDPAAAAQVAAHPDGDTVAGSTPSFLIWASLSAFAFVFLAAPVVFARDYMSDEEAFGDAVASQRVDSIQAYIRAGGRHAEEAEAIHLPAAAFAEAQRTGTVTALREFIVAHPAAPQAPQARQVIHQRFEQVHAEFLAQANRAKPQMPAFMEALLAWLEAHDSPPVQVRFAPPSSETLAEVDATLRARGDNITPISPHFTVDRMESHETAITDVLRRGFGSVFPEDVMSLSHGGRTANVDANVPTFDVHYSVVPSGATYTSQESGREFVGIAVVFDVNMSIPDSAATYRFEVNVEPPEHFRVNYQDMAGGPSDGVVYRTMARLAFDQLSNQVVMVFFAPGSQAFMHAAQDAAAQAPPPPPNPLAGPGGLSGLEGLEGEALQERIRELLEQAQQGQ